MLETVSPPALRKRLAPAVKRLPDPAATWLRQARAAMRAAATAAQDVNGSGVRAPKTHTRAGMVEQFDRRHIVGWVSGPANSFPLRVTLHVNELEVAATWVSAPSSLNAYAEVRTFLFNTVDLWDYCSRSNKITVRLDGVPLPIAGHGTYKVPHRRGKYSLADLRSRFAEGYLFSQRGRLQLSKQRDTAWQGAVLDLYARVSAVVKREFGYDPFLVYGTLLGYAREGHFIGHDVDFDAAYISRHTRPRRAAIELRDIALRLIDEGFDVECKYTALHVSDVSDPETRIDLFHLFFDEHDELQVPFGVASPAPFPKSRWTGIAEGELAGHTVTIPNSAREFAAHLYGPAWTVPIPGFSWDRERARSVPQAYTKREHREEVYWANFYARHKPAEGSTFFESIVSRDDVPSTVLDIGCGDGRDSFAFARRGARVHGIDRSTVGVRHAAQSASSAGLGDRLSFTAVDVAQARDVQDAVATLRAAADGGPILFYARFFLHSIPEDVQHSLLRALAECSRDGDVLAAEFRTAADAENKKVFGGHYRRYQDGAAFGRSLREKYGFADIRLEQESAGLAPYKDEDPVVYRVVAGRTPAAPAG